MTVASAFKSGILLVVAVVVGWFPASAARLVEATNPVLGLQQGDPSTLSVTDWHLEVRLTEGTAQLEERVVLHSSAAQTVTWQPTVAGGWWLDGKAVDDLTANLKADSDVTLEYKGSVSTIYGVPSALGLSPMASSAPRQGQRWGLEVRFPASWEGKAERQPLPHGDLDIDTSGLYRSTLALPWRLENDHWRLDLTRHGFVAGAFEAVMLVGTLQPIGMSIQMQGTHRLVDEAGRTRALLEADPNRPVNLDLFLGQRVQVVGDMGNAVEGGANLLHVRSVKAR